MFIPGLLTGTSLNSDENKYYEIIQASIDKDKEKIDLEQDFDKEKFSSRILKR